VRQSEAKAKSTAAAKASGHEGTSTNSLHQAAGCRLQAPCLSDIQISIELTKVKGKASIVESVAAFGKHLNSFRLDCGSGCTAPNGEGPARQTDERRLEGTNTKKAKLKAGKGKHEKGKHEKDKHGKGMH
jgi:hypothetical protein